MATFLAGAFFKRQSTPITEGRCKEGNEFAAGFADVERAYVAAVEAFAWIQEIKEAGSEGSDDAG